MTTSSHYSDHLIAALRCLDDDNLRLLAASILDRLPEAPAQQDDTAKLCGIIGRALEACSSEAGLNYDERLVSGYARVMLSDAVKQFKPTS